MGLFTVVSNGLKAAVGYQQQFEELLGNGDVTRAMSMMHDHSEEAAANLKFYNIGEHEVMKREDRAVYDKKGNFLRWSKRWKLPIAFPEYINEIALVFLYGRPVKWSQLSDGTDEAFDRYKKLLSEIRFDSHVREAKRVAGAQGISAIVYHVFKKDGKPALELKVLDKEEGDDIFTMRDQYGRVKAAGWGYSLTEAGGKTVYHVDIFTKEKYYFCKRGGRGWEVREEANPIGKIPMLIFEQKPEAGTVQPLIERYENLGSVDADVNDRFSNPALVATAEVLNSLPKQEEEAKLFILKNGGQLNYLTWDQSSKSKENEYARLEKHILSKSFTPDINFENMKSLGNMSAKAIMKIFMLAVIKAERHKEKHDGYMNRHGHLMLAIMGNVLDYKNKSKYEALVLGHEFQQPFGEDVSDTLNDALKQHGAGALSTETLVEISYLVKNAQQELKRLREEQDEAMERQQEMNRQDAFGPTD